MPRRMPDGAAALRARVLREAAVVAVLSAAFAVASVVWDLPSVLGGPWDDVVAVLAFSHLLMIVFGHRRSRELTAEGASRRAAEAELRRRARHDALTGLPNRVALLEELEHAPAGATAVLLVDLDRFKEINDTLGHDLGDRLLQAVATRLPAHLPHGALVARLGGDEFAVLLRGRDASTARNTAEAVLAAVRRPYRLGDLVLEVDGSCGVATYTAGEAPGDVLRHADVAMYAAKEEHLGVTVYEPDLDADAADQLSLFGDLRRAVRTGELLLHYQPKVSLREGRVVGVEALVRWQHPRRGMVPPGSFIPLAEQTGLIRPLTAEVLRQALADCAAWRLAGLGLTVAVNLSARSLLDEALVPDIDDLLRRHDLPAGCLELEITESAAMTDPGRALQVLHDLRDLGVHLSVDDYGTGHASLAYLSRLPVGTLKIDRSFVSMMEVDASDRTIVRSTIDLAHGLGLRVVAEGVETHAAWHELGRLGCDEAQGYWLARPGPAADVRDSIDGIRRRLLVGSAI